MKVRKILSMLLVSAMTLTLLAGCGADTGTDEDTSGQKEQSAEADADEGQDAETEDSEMPGEGKTLVVYYSASGNTKEAANAIAAATGGDLFEIEPVEPYSDEELDWTDDNSRVSREHENEDEREVELVSTTVDGWDSYDTVFIGYPIWWGIAAWPTDGFVKANDFTGKRGIPFCTSASSGIGESGELLAELAGTGDWQEGERFRSGVSESDIQEWVEELGY